MCARLPVSAGVALAVLASSFSVAGAAPTRIRLSRPANGNALVRELTARAAGEAVAAGFSVDLQERIQERQQERRQEPERQQQPESIPPDAPPVVSIFEGPPGDGSEDALIEVTVGQRLVYRAIVRRNQSTADDGGRILAAAAVRAVAALQTALLDRSPHPDWELVSTAAISSPQAEKHAAPRAGARVGIGAAVSLLQSLQGLPVAFLPTLKLGLQATNHVAVGLRLMGLGTSAMTTTPAGTARTRQDAAMGEVAIRSRTASRIHPVLVAGAGVYQMNMQGTGTAPYVGRSERSWHLATDLGIGVVVDLTAHLSLTLDSHTLWLWPQPMVQIQSVDTGRAGRPSLTHSLGLLVWL